jgi:hypothetical protein
MRNALLAAQTQRDEAAYHHTNYRNALLAAQTQRDEADYHYTNY